MKRVTFIKNEFVEYIPNDIQDGTIYISIEFATAVHNCCCGCGNKVITPFSPTDWKLIFDGETISLYPSVGNWSFECQSHYWIESNRVKWASKWSKEQISSGLKKDELNKKEYYKDKRHRSFINFLFKK